MAEATVLVVDDEPALRRALEATLAAEGYWVERRRPGQRRSRR